MTMKSERPAATTTGSVDGVILLDKPCGMTSNGALQTVRRLFGRVKAGHTGTLDPLATGLLPLCLGEATKYAAGLLEADKTYEATIQLGVATTTGDAEGEAVFRGEVAGCPERVPAILAEFTGEIDQLPPMFSALKHQGRPLYSYARAGEEVERRPRRVTVRGLELLSPIGPEFKVRVRCSKGTYIRTLAQDIGARLGCGAHLTTLRRTAIGGLDIAEAVTLDRLESAPDIERLAWLRPMDLLVSDLQSIVLDTPRAEAILQGRLVDVADSLSPGAVRIYTADGAFLGLGMGGEGGRLAPKRMRAGPLLMGAAAGCDAA
jgi:tRNA pseudouridine55 synthase